MSTSPPGGHEENYISDMRHQALVELSTLLGVIRGFKEDGKVRFYHQRSSGCWQSCPPAPPTSAPSPHHHHPVSSLSLPNEVPSGHMGADVARKNTPGDVIVINARLPPHPPHNLGGRHQDNSLHDVETAVAMAPQQPSPHPASFQAEAGQPIRVIYSLALCRRHLGARMLGYLGGSECLRI